MNLAGFTNPEYKPIAFFFFKCRVNIFPLLSLCPKIMSKRNCYKIPSSVQVFLSVAYIVSIHCKYNIRDHNNKVLHRVTGSILGTDLNGDMHACNASCTLLLSGHEGNCLCSHVKKNSENFNVVFMDEMQRK